jgi:hypothetical protein
MSDTILKEDCKREIVWNYSQYTRILKYALDIYLEEYRNPRLSAE